MDTRAKIVDTAHAARVAREGALVVRGYFDPMVASHAEELGKLKQAGKPLLVLISNPPDPILPARARAQLVAGLAAVDYVCDSPGALTPEVTLEAQHVVGRENLIRHVHSRQRVAS